MVEIDCAWVEGQDLVARYIGGRLGEPEAASLELHFAACERCWAEIHAAAGIRAARGLDVFAAPSAAKPRATRDAWTVLAAAAAVAMMAVGLGQLTQRPEVSASDPVWRGSRMEALPLIIDSNPSGQLALRWPSHPEAEVYVVEIFASDGSTVWERETSETSVSLEVGTLAESEPGISFSATVEALDATRQTIARSKRIRLPKS
jgi:hypothetical protein